MLKRLTFIFIILLSSSSLAVNIENPRLVDSMTAEVVQKVNINVSGSPESVSLLIYVPQNDSFQKLLSLSAEHDYEFVKDKFGNILAKFVWTYPKSRISLSIKSVVQIKARERDENYRYKEFLRPNSLVNYNSEIRETAESLTIGKKGFEKIAALVSWVNENVNYDINYFPVNLSATEVFRIRRGVCDEYSTLLSALARSIGYYSPYIVGYAYGKDGFEPHGWTSINGFLADPTWAEMPIDATHIKFAVLDSPVYTEANVSAKGGENISLSVNTEIKPLSVHISKKVKASSKFLPNPGQYAVLRTDLSSDGCVLTRLVVKSCTVEGSPFLSGGFERNINFCGGKTVFSVMKALRDIRNIRAVCPVTVLVYDGGEEIVNLTLTGTGKNEKVKLNVDRTMFELGERFSVSSPGAYIFMDGQHGFENASFTAKENATLYVYKNGMVDSRNITVVKEKPIEVYLKVKDRVYLGEATAVNVTIENRMKREEDVIVTLRDQLRHVKLPPLSNRTVTFSFSPKDVNDNILQIGFHLSEFSTSVTKTITVARKNDWLDMLTDSFSSIFETFAGFLTSILKNLKI